MKWKNKAVTKITGISLSSSVRELAMAINHNAEILIEAVQKIEELSDKVDRLKVGGADGD
jgi:hypothetical protein|nr:MAG TPA: hypothetical protein [Caudoviricetes sp.]DAQ95222.1 MAG TPA: hypothetical protein [Caudoviricetes sp.]